MAARKTTEVEYDFDNWSEEAEEQAVQAAVPEVKHIIVEGTFVGRFSDGDIVKMPLKLSLADADELTGRHENQVDQFREMVRAVGGDAAVKQFVEHDIIEAVIMAEKFFRVINRVQQAAFPES